MGQFYALAQAGFLETAVLPDGRRTVLGVSVALSEAEVHWRDFLNGLVARGMRGVQYIVSDDHAGLGAADLALKSVVAHFAETAPKLTSWLETNVPDGLTVLKLPKSQRRRLRTSNGIKRPIQQELKRRTVKIRVFEC